MTMKVFGAVMIAWCVAAVTGDASSAEHTDRRPHRYRQPPPNAGDGGGATYHWPALDVGLDAKKTGVPVGPHGAAPTSKAVFAHYMLCFAAFGEKGNSSNATSGYAQEMAMAQANGLDGFAIEYLGRDSYYLPAAIGMFAACEAHNAALPPGAKPFRLFVIINFCCGLNLTDAVLLYERFHNHSCAHVEPTTSRPMFSSWGAVQSKRPFAVEAARWEVGFFAPIAAARLPRPFFLPFIYPANYTNAETPTLAQQQAIVAGMGSTIDGLWYWGCAPLADAVAASSGATVAACRAAGKFVATPVSGPYSPHSKYNNRYSQSRGAKAVIDTWTEHIASQPDMVIFTTWNDLGEHHYVGPYNLELNYFDPGNTFPHLAYLALSRHFIAWYKQPAGSPPPAVASADEAVFYFYNLQPVNNSCPGDPAGPPDLRSDPGFPLEDALYATLLLAKPAELVLMSGLATGASGPQSVLRETVPAGLVSFQVPRRPGMQRVVVSRAGEVLVNVTGAERVNVSTAPAVLADCNHQTFTGYAGLMPM